MTWFDHPLQTETLLSQWLRGHQPCNTALTFLSAATLLVGVRIRGAESWQGLQRSSSRPSTPTTTTKRMGPGSRSGKMSE